MNRQEKICSYSIMIVAVLMTIINYIELPGSVVLPIVSYGYATYVLSKTSMLVIPLFITISGLFIYLKTKKQDLISIPLIGIMIAVITLLFNLK